MSTKEKNQQSLLPNKKVSNSSVLTVHYVHSSNLFQGLYCAYIIATHLE